MTQQQSSANDLSPQEKRELLEKLLKERAAKSVASMEIATAIQPMDRSEGFLPLSSAQKRILFLDQYEPNTPTYNIPVIVRLEGSLDVQSLEASLNEIVNRHEPLRTNYWIENGQAAQEIIHGTILHLNTMNLELIPKTDREPEMRRLMLEESRHPFQLSHDLKIRALLLTLDSEDHLLVITMHHISSDGWSLGVLLKELTALYKAFTAGKPSPLADLQIQYTDFVNWHQHWFQGDVMERQLQYWKKKLENAPALLELPTDRPRPAVQDYRGARYGFHWSLELTNAIKAFSRQEGVTLFMALLAVFQTLLFRYTRQDNIVIGTPIAGRARPEIKDLIGLFINTIVMRSDLSGDPTFVDFLHRVQQTALNAYEHPDLPFDMLVEQLHPTRSLSYSPLFQVMFALQNISLSLLQLEGLKTTAFMETPTGTSKVNLSLTMIEAEGGLVGEIEYSTALFDEATIMRMTGHLQSLVADIVKHPDQHLSEFNLLTEQERRQIISEWNQTRIDLEPIQIQQMFEAQVLRSKEAIAINFEGTQLTYQKLNEHANKLAHYLRKLGVGPDTLVGMHMHRSPETVVALLGILKAGGAYIPLDPSFPAERLAYMVSDSRLSILLTQQQLVDHISTSEEIAIVCIDSDWPQISQEDDQNPPNNGAQIRDLAYVIYTSGSTGNPKGVQIEHGNVVNFLTSMQERLGLTDRDTLLSVTTLSFDISVLEILLPLITGAQLVLVSRDTATNAEQLMKELANSKATMMQATPTTWQMLMDAGWQGNKRLKILCGGEALSVELANRIAERGFCLWNMYGPTETTIWSTMHRFQPDEKEISIGSPIGNTQCYILDSHRQPVPIGVAGELFIGGKGVARGYLNRPELTSERFIPDPFNQVPGVRLYRTGDLVRYDPNGNIRFLGRIDHQVKIRGFRIELGEIETVLAQYPTIQQAVVTVREDDNPGNKRLVAYMILHTGTPEPAAGEIRSFLAGKLPEYMIPSSYVYLDAYPLTPNQKIDRKALPVPNQTRPELTHQFMAPRDETESAVAEIFARVLKLERIGVQDNFFELGGHSLLVTQAVSRIRQELNVELPLRTLFEAPTPEELALVIVHKKVEQLDNIKLSELLADVENMSTEEVQALLDTDQ